MYLYFGGAEIPGHRTLLASEGVERVSLSYMGLRRRVKFVKPWLLRDKFDMEKQKILLDSGAYTINNAEDKFSQNELYDISAHYMNFVMDNIDDVELVTEFDTKILGMDWIKAMREDFYNDLPSEKFMPIWHPEFGVDELTSLASTYKNVGVPQTALDGRNLAPLLNSLAASGTHLHGMAMTKPQAMESIKFSSVSSTSWISPSQFGDTIVWTGKELKRYPKKYKEQARKRHRVYFNSIGFDAQDIEDDDRIEVLRLSIWSWQQQMEHLKTHQVVTTRGSDVDSANTEFGGEEVDTTPSEPRNTLATRRATTALPVFNTKMSAKASEDDDTAPPVALVHARSESMRMCDSCFLSAKCPAFEPGSNCAYNIDIEIRTTEQVRSLQDALIEMQAQRVLFMRMTEDLEGGYADPNLSNEMDRLQKLIKTKADLESDMFTVKFEAKGRGGSNGGVISRLFGRDAGEQVQALDAPIKADDAIKIIDAEVVE